MSSRATLADPCVRRAARMASGSESNRWRDLKRLASNPGPTSRPHCGSRLPIVQGFPDNAHSEKRSAPRSKAVRYPEAGGRKLVVTPDGAPWAPRPRVDNAMVKALARSFRWRRMLDEGVYATLKEQARAKGVHATYVSRILRLTLLAPDIVEAIVYGRQPAELQLDGLLTGFPLEWVGQFGLICGEQDRPE